MARMYPVELPAAVLGDPRLAAERELYEALGEQLSDDTLVFHGVAWLARRRDADAQDGEADFVILRRDLGLLVLEVKGGRIARDGATGRWASIDRKGTVHEIHDPVDQARRSHHALLEKVRSLPKWGSRWLQIGHAVAFPDCAAPRGAPTPDAPREITIFADDMKWLDHKIDAIFEYWQRGLRKSGPLDEGRMRLLEEVFAPRFELRQPLGATMREEDREIVRLTEQQVRVLDGLARNRRVAVRGGAGTGKTFLALENARRLAGEGYRTLLTCFNHALRDFLRASAGEAENLVVANFHLLCGEMARKGESSGHP